MKTHYLAMMSILPLWPHVPTAIASAGANDHSQRFLTIREPANEASILETVCRIEQLIQSVGDPHKVTNRERYIRDLAKVLRSSCYADSLSTKTGYALDEDRLAPEDRPLIKLRMRTVARVLRCLGDLEAAEVTETIGEFLGFPHDIYVRSPFIGTREAPARWALIQIGDRALPLLRDKMRSDDLFTRRYAAFVVGDILGPRGADELERWISEAKTTTERQRLEEHKTLIVLHAEAELHSGKTPEKYREDMLRDGRAYIKERLRNPGLCYPEDWDEWRQQNKKRREKGDQLKDVSSRLPHRNCHAVPDPRVGAGTAA